FSFVKKAAGTGKPIGGVKFLLESEDGSQSVSIYTDDNGCYSSSSDNILHSHNTNRGEPGDGIWFGEAEVDDKLGALPYGTYRLSELECEANAGKYKLIEPVIFEIKEDSGTVDLGIIYNEDDTTTEATTEVTTETTTEVTTEVTTENTTETTTWNTTEATTGNTTENTTEVTSGDTTEATTKVTTEISDTPDTGDGIPVMLILILMAGAVVSIAGVIFYKKKYSEMDKRR
ncbi:MAG: LPXTG cell wall anchor domain-containing protein, partial [Clostridiales bacterium]|nr:LPXTG cell wall anchor domain-containing protein [Clostridiales bacterium]